MWKKHTPFFAYSSRIPEVPRNPEVVASSATNLVSAEGENCFPPETAVYHSSVLIPVAAIGKVLCYGNIVLFPSMTWKNDYCD